MEISSPEYGASVSVPTIVVPFNQNASVSEVLQPLSTLTVDAPHYEIFSSNGSVVSGHNLVPGYYTVYSENGTKSNITVLYVDRNVTVRPAMEPSYVLGLNNSASASGNYTIRNGMAIIVTSNSSILLPYGSYSIQFNSRVSNTTGSFTLSGSASVSLVANETVRVSVHAVPFYTQVTGKAYVGGSPAALSSVVITGENGSKVAATSTGVSGAFSVNLTSGDYGIYVTDASGSYAYFGSFTVGPFQKSEDLVITLQKAGRVYVSENLGSQLLHQNVTVSSNGASMNVTPFTYFVLPYGNYSFSSSISKHTVINGINETITFGTNVTQSVAGTTYVQLTLVEEPVASFIVKQTQVPNVTLLGSVEVKFQLSNAGNFNATVNLSSASSSWVAAFNRSSIYLPVGATVNLSAQLRMVKPVQSGTEEVPVSVRYSSGNSTVDLTVNVTQVPGISLSTSVPGIPDGKALKLPVYINNTGDTGILLTPSIGNQSGLNFTHWNATLTYANGTAVHHVYLASAST
ncbi:hypothetical protein [Thermogymnomonas acidicola]|uniref:hypothetical protein n=1 Tax=Thermogymnomonas acidicola TaxID=399579 RepID=UPI001494502C|nr:hypothetical protein [Thermogymnomonas acidicola]